MIRKTLFSKRILNIKIIAVVILFFTLTGCQIVNKPSSNVSSSDNENSRKPVTFTALLSDSNARINWDKSEICNEITKRTGIKLDLEILKGDLSSKVSTMIASGSYPDILLSIDNDSVSLLAEANALFPLDQLIESKGTNIRKVFGDDINFMKNVTDNKIYGLNREYKGISARSEAMFFVQYDMLIKAGAPKIKTLDDLYNLMKNYKLKNLLFKGLDTLGLSFWGDSWGMNVTVNNAALRAGGYQNDGNYVVDNNLNVKYGLTLPSTKIYLKWLNKLYLAGLLDSDAIVQGREKFVEKVSSGRVLVATTENWDMGDSEAALRKSGLNDRCYAQIPVYISTETDSEISNYNPFGSWKSVITRDCKDPVRAFEFFDEMWSQEMQILCNWGIDKVHYDIKDGKRVMKKSILDASISDPNWKSNTGISIFNMWSYGENYKGTDGQYIVPFGTTDELYDAQDVITQNVMKMYGITSWKQLCPTPKPSKWGFVWNLSLPQNTEGAFAESKVNNDIRRKYLPQIILANNDNAFNENWNQFVESSKRAGINVRENEISQILKKRAVK